MNLESLWLDQRRLPWPVGRLKDHVDLINGFPFDSSGFNHAVGTPVIRIRDLLIGRAETLFDGRVPDEVIVHAVTWSSGWTATSTPLRGLAAELR